MKTTLLVFSMMVPLPLFAQPTVDRYQFDRLGDAGEYLGVQEMGLQPGPTGDGVVWDFSNVPHKPIVNYAIRYLEPKDAPHADAYPGADLVRHFKRGGREHYTYLQTRGKRLYQLGVEDSATGTQRYTDVSFFPDLTLALNQTNRAEIDGTYDQIRFLNAPRRYRLQGETAATYDGYGTLVLPNGQRHTDVIRLKTTKIWTESDGAGSLSLVTRKEEVRYLYFEPGHSAYLFEIIETRFYQRVQGAFRFGYSSKFAGYRAESESKPLLTAKRGTHLTNRSALFQSEILVHNPTENTQTLQLTGLDDQGVTLPMTDINVAPGTTMRQDAFEGLGPDAASFYATGCKECILSVDYRATNTVGSSAQVHQTQDYRREFRFYPGEWDQLSEGQAIVNVSDEPMEITATQLDFQGNLLKKVILEEALPPGGKHLSLLNDVFLQQPDSMILLKSEGLMSVMALRISNDSQFLYQNQALPEGVDGTRSRWLPHMTSQPSGFATEVLVYNQDEAPQQLLFQPYDHSGKALANQLITVPAGAPRRYSKQALFSDDTSHAPFLGPTNLPGVTCLPG